MVKNPFCRPPFGACIATICVLKADVDVLGQYEQAVWLGYINQTFVEQTLGKHWAG